MMPTLYRSIMIDPPWKEQGGGQIKRGADRHYDLMDTYDIIKAIKTSGVFTPHPKGCHLYLWVTNSFLEDGLRVMRELGFRYITNLVWAKDRFGLGQYFRQQTELCLFGVAGSETLMTSNRSTSNLIQEPKREHSQKPEAIYQLIEACSIPPPPRHVCKVEERRLGWLGR